MSVQFACEACGSPSVTFPARVTDDALITCGGCGLRLASWADFKRRTRQTVLREGVRRRLGREPRSADPRATEERPGAEA